LNGKAWCLANLGMNNEALPIIEESLKLDPNSATSFDTVDFVHYNLGNYSNALEDYDKAIEINPRYPRAWYYRGLALKKLGRDKEAQESYAEAIKYYDEATKIDSSSPDMWLRKGSAYHESGRYKEAIQSYDEALEIDPKNADAWGNKGSALDSLEKYEEAIECYDKAVELDPRYAYVRDELLVRLVDKDTAAAQIAKTVGENFDKLPENVQNLLFKLADNKETASGVAHAITANFDKLPENVRNELLGSLPEKDRTSLGRLARGEEKPRLARGEEKPTLRQLDWDSLVESIHRKECVPFIGSGASVPWIPSDAEIARNWAALHNYPLEDSSDLARVAQFLAIQNDEVYPKKILSKELKERRLPGILDEAAAYAVLAYLNLSIYITTNYDYFMEEALRNAGKEPVSEFFSWNDFLKEISKSPDTRSVFAIDKKYKPTQERPLVYHLFGTIDTPASMVLTEKDYSDFGNFFNKAEKTVLPPVIRMALTKSSLLFLGYGLEGIKFRTISETILNFPGSSAYGQLRVAVQLPPREEMVVGEKKARNYLTQLAEKVYKVRLYWGTVSEFANDLRQRIR